MLPLDLVEKLFGRLVVAVEQGVVGFVVDLLRRPLDVGNLVIRRAAGSQRQTGSQANQGKLDAAIARQIAEHGGGRDSL